MWTEKWKKEIYNYFEKIDFLKSEGNEKELNYYILEWEKYNPSLIKKKQQWENKKEILKIEAKINECRKNILKVCENLNQNDKQLKDIKKKQQIFLKAIDFLKKDKNSSFKNFIIKIFTFNWIDKNKVIDKNIKDINKQITILENEKIYLKWQIRNNKTTLQIEQEQLEKNTIEWVENIDNFVVDKQQNGMKKTTSFVETQTEINDYLEHHPLPELIHSVNTIVP